MDLLKKYLLSSVARKPDDGAGAGAASGDGANAGGDAGKGSEGQQQQQQQEKDKPGDYVTLAEDDDDEIVVGDDGEDDEPGDEGEGADGKPKEGEEGSEKRPSGSARLKARNARLARENEELRQALQAPKRAPAAGADDDADLKEPKESDFPNDYLAYERALRQYETRKAIREENRRTAKSQDDAEADRAHRATLNSYNERLTAVKDRIPDFDDVMTEAKGTQIRDDVLNQILESSKGPLIAYHLAKNPDKVDALNRMAPLAAAKEIGRLEARIRGPQSKKATSAKAPIRAPKGGTGGSDAKPKDPSTLPMADYIKGREDGTIQ